MRIDIRQKGLPERFVYDLGKMVRVHFEGFGHVCEFEVLFEIGSFGRHVIEQRLRVRLCITCGERRGFVFPLSISSVDRSVVDLRLSHGHKSDGIDKKCHRNDVDVVKRIRVVVNHYVKEALEKEGNHENEAEPDG